MKTIEESLFLGTYEYNVKSLWNKEQEEKAPNKRRKIYKNTLYTREYHFLGDYLGASADFYLTPLTMRFISDFKYFKSKGLPLETKVFDVQINTMYGREIKSISLKEFLNIEHKVLKPLQNMFKRFLQIKGVLISS